MKWLTLLILMNSVAFAEITSGIDTLAIMFNQNQSINFTLNSVADHHSLFYGTTPFYPCTTKTTDDLLAFSNDFNTCSCPCADWGGIGCPRPFYKSKRVINQLNLSKPLVLADTSVFVKIDTVAVDTQNNGYAFPCVLPFVYVPRTAKDSVYIVKTSSNKFVLVRIRPVDFTISSMCDIFSTSFTTLGGFEIIWYLQNDGSLDFSSVTGIKFYPGDNKNNPGLKNKSSPANQLRIGFPKEILKYHANAFYSINGKKIKYVNLEKINRLIIYR